MVHGCPWYRSYRWWFSVIETALWAMSSLLRSPFLMQRCRFFKFFSMPMGSRWHERTYKRQLDRNAAYFRKLCIEKYEKMQITSEDSCLASLAVLVLWLQGTSSGWHHICGILCDCGPCGRKSCHSAGRWVFPYRMPLCFDWCCSFAFFYWQILQTMGCPNLDLVRGSWLNSIERVWPRTWNGVKPGGLSSQDRFRRIKFSPLHNVLFKSTTECRHAEQFFFCQLPLYFFSIQFYTLLWSGFASRDGGCWESGLRGGWRVQREPCWQLGEVLCE